MAENNQNMWKNKIKAFLHDPVLKCFDIINHESKALPFLKILDINYNKSESDNLSSSMDRFPLPFELKNKGPRIIIDSEQLQYFQHPLSGNSLDVFSPIKEYYSEDVIKRTNEKFRKFLSDLKEKYKDDYQKIFYELWWKIPSFYKYIDFLPADTRVPYHSILDHLDMTSAIESCLYSQNKPCFLQVAIGPIQKFIATSKKTVDLWMGSYLLSYLSFQAIKVIGKKYGYDNVVFPNMRNQYFTFDELKKNGLDLPDSSNILPKDIASLPNRFLAIVPFSEAENTVMEIKEGIIEEWNKISEYTFDSINMDKTEKEELKKYWEMQKTTFPEFYWSCQEWFKENELKNEMDNFFKDSDIERYNEEIKKFVALGSYDLKEGTYYGYNFELVRRKLDAVKSTTIVREYLDARPVDGDSLSGEFKMLFEDSENRIKLNTFTTIKILLVD